MTIIEIWKQMEEARLAGNDQEYQRLRKLMHEEIKNDINNIFDDIKEECKKEAKYFDLDQLRNAMQDPYFGYIYQDEFLKRELDEKEKEQEELEKQNKITQLLNLNELVRTINLIGLTDEIDDISLENITFNNKAYNIKLNDTCLAITCNDGRELVIHIDFTKKEVTDDGWDSYYINQTELSIDFYRYGKCLNFKAILPKTGYDSLFELSKEELAKEINPYSYSLRGVSWDFVDRNKKIMFTNDELTRLNDLFDKEINRIKELRTNPLEQVKQMVKKLSKEDRNKLNDYLNKKE
jgi:hypothetical protein